MTGCRDSSTGGTIILVGLLLATHLQGIWGSDVSDDNSVSLWIEGLRAGDEEDIRRLWERYFGRLVRLARARLPSNARRALDEEDIALSAFQSFCDHAGRGSFPKLDDRDDLWCILSTIAVRKVIAALRARFAPEARRRTRLSRACRSSMTRPYGASRPH